MRYQSNRPKRQFLAGVVCPTCKKIDTIVQVQVFEPDYDEYIECIECGHHEHRPTPDEQTTKQEHATQANAIGIVKFR